MAGNGLNEGLNSPNVFGQPVIDKQAAALVKSYEKSRRFNGTTSDVESDQTTFKTGEFDPGSERTLAAGLTHASRTRTSVLVANG